MKTQRAQTPDTQFLAELRRREQELTSQPSAEGYFNLANEYHALGLNKESDRLMQVAERLEVDPCSEEPRSADGLLSGTANPVMLIEVLQILSRTKLTGEFIIENAGEMFRVYLENGRVINASSQHHPEGLESFRMALRVTRGTYRFVQRRVDDVAKAIQEKTEILILNIMGEEDKNDANAFIR